MYSNNFGKNVHVVRKNREMALSFHKLVIDANLTGTFAGLQNYDQSTLNIDYEDPWCPYWNINNKGFLLDHFQQGLKLSNGVITLESSFDVPGVKTSFLHNFESFTAFNFYIDETLKDVFVENQKMDFKRGILDTTLKFVKKNETIKCKSRIFVSRHNKYLVVQELKFDKPNVKLFRNVFTNHNMYNIQYNNGLEYEGDKNMQMLSGESTLADRNRTKVAFASTYKSDNNIEYLGIKRDNYGSSCQDVLNVKDASKPIYIVTFMASEDEFIDPVFHVRRLMYENKDDTFEDQEKSWSSFWNKGNIEVQGKTKYALRTALYQLWSPVCNENYIDPENIFVTKDSLLFLIPIYVMMKPSIAKGIIEKLEKNHFQYNTSNLFAIHVWNCYRNTGDRNWLRRIGFSILEKNANHISQIQNDEKNAFEMYLNKLVLHYAIQACYVLNIQVYSEWRESYNTGPLTYYSDKNKRIIQFDNVLNLLILTPYYSDLFFKDVSDKCNPYNVSSDNTIIKNNIEKHSDLNSDNTSKIINATINGILGNKDIISGVIKDFEDKELHGIWKQFKDPIVAAKYLWMYIEGAAQLQVVGEIEENGYSSQGLGLNYIPENKIPWKYIKILTEKKGLIVSNKN